MHAPRHHRAGCAARRSPWSIVLLLVTAILGSGVLASAARSGSAPVQIIDVKRSYGTTDPDLRRAIRAARFSGRALYFAAGTYTYRSELVLDGVTAFGDGPASILDAESPSRSAVVLTGEGPMIRDLQITSPGATRRVQTSAAAGVRVEHATGFDVRRVTIAGAENAGIVVFAASSGRIVDNTVSGTLADGIHLTDGSHYVTVAGNTVHDVGDDMIAVVSYLADRVPCAHILITGNDVYRQTSGRGITVVGGQGVTVRSNRIAGTYGAGILVASDASYGTYGTVGVSVVGNNVDGTDLGQIGHAGIQLYGQSGSSIQGTVVSGNVVTNPSSRGIYVGSHTQATTISGNRLSDVQGQGIVLNGARDTSVTANTLSQVDENGIQVTGAARGRLTIDSNQLTDVNRIRQPQVSVIDIEPNPGPLYGEVVDNVYSNPGGYPFEALVDSANPGITVSGNRLVG